MVQRKKDWSHSQRWKFLAFIHLHRYLCITYHIRPNYCTYPYKCTVKQVCSLQIIASELFVYFFRKAYVVGIFELHRLVNAIQMSTHNICSFKENQEKKKPTKTSHKHHLISLLLIFLCTLSIGGYIFYHSSVFPVILKT